MSDQPRRKWRVKGRQGNRPVTDIVDTSTKESAEEYAKFVARERSKVPLEILETTEKTKKKKP